MGSGKRSSSSRQQANHRTRNTRSSKSRLLTADPTENTQVLTTQLRTLGLYAANTLGDGNCLFRALSDQYYGSPSRHVEVRRDVCNWIQQHQERYEGFVDEDEFGSGGGQDKLHEYLSRMRENATYGGHMELSAFAHMTRRNIKVIQPGLVYIIQCDSTPGPSQNTPDERQQDLSDVEDEDDYVDEPTIYVAYHDWEHFSSIRNLKGPHAGLPCVRESTGVSAQTTPARKPPSSASKIKLKINLSKSKSRSTSSDPSTAPLPASTPPTRSPSPGAPHSRPRPASAISPATALSLSRAHHRSPKRSFDESSEASGTSSSSGGASKRSKTVPEENQSSSQLPDVVETESSSDDEEGGNDDDVSPSHSNSTPFLSAASSASSSSLSSVPSSSPEPTPPPPEPEEEEKPLTRRQRKRLGLPKQRPVSAGKIIIPGGRFLKNKAAAAQATAGVEVATEDEEWKTNGSGRMDVRGFRELKI